MYIGSVEIPAIKTIEKTKETSGEEIYGCGLDESIPIPESELTTKVTITGTLIPGVVSGSVASVSLNAGGAGSGYKAAPTVTIAAPTSGIRATATARINCSVQTISPTAGGTGYTSAPTVTVAASPSGPGATATATATVDAGAVTAITVTYAGYGYQGVPSITFGGPGTGAAATATLNGSPISYITVTDHGSGYTSVPSVSFSGGGGGTGAAATATVTTSSASLQTQVENVLSLTNKTPAQCYVNVEDLNGYLEVTSVKPKVSASKIGSREVTIESVLYQNLDVITVLPDPPEILSNDWSRTLSTDGVDCYTATPIGSSYYGGDVGTGTTITRASVDGTMTLVRTNTKDINVSIDVNEHNTGECKLYDTIQTGEVNQGNWELILNDTHEFMGDLVIDNGMVRLIVQNKTMNLYAYYSDDGTNPEQWHSHGTIEYKPLTDAGTVISKYFSRLTSDEITLVQVRDYLEGDGTTNQARFSVSLKRGSYIFDFIAMDTTANLDLAVTYPSGLQYAYVPAVTYDAAVESANVDTDLTTDNFTIAWSTAIRAYTITAHQNLHDVTLGLDNTNDVWSSVKVKSHGIDSKSTVGVIPTAADIGATPTLTNAAKNGPQDIARQSLVKFKMNRVLSTR